MKLDMCVARIRPSGSHLTEVVRGEFSPVSYPEVELLRHLHGDDSVTGVAVCGSEDRTQSEERERLRLRYGARAMDDVYPGRATRLPFVAPDEVPRLYGKPKRSRKAAAQPESDKPSETETEAEGDPQYTDDPARLA